ncbi:MAG: hypothetical protein MR424_03240 [Treponema sp.]|nr:hypothetical protein [Treponema sp.]MCI7566660.1 hypothetical protein [Treponema sp.]MDY5124086.1 hypothetical protein [Treponema sp.]
MDIKGKNGSLKISVEEIEKIGENISSFINSFFSKKQNSEKKENNDTQLPNYTRFSNDEFGIEDI